MSAPPETLDVETEMDTVARLVVDALELDPPASASLYTQLMEAMRPQTTLDGRDRAAAAVLARLRDRIEAGL